MGDRYFADYISEVVDNLIAEESERIEFDLRLLLGRRVHWSDSRIKAIGYEVAYQNNTYRGVLLHGEWVIDYHPDWPFTNEAASRIKRAYTPESSEETK